MFKCAVQFNKSKCILCMCVCMCIYVYVYVCMHACNVCICAEIKLMCLIKWLCRVQYGKDEFSGVF